MSWTLTPNYNLKRIDYDTEENVRHGIDIKEQLSIRICGHPFVSYYTNEWTVGGLHPKDAVKRKSLSAKWFLQKDKLNHKKYSKPDYYFYVYWEKVAPFTEPKHKKILDEKFPIVESGDKWFIYKMQNK